MAKVLNSRNPSANVNSQAYLLSKQGSKRPPMNI